MKAGYDIPIQLDIFNEAKKHLHLPDNLELEGLRLSKSQRKKQKKLSRSKMENQDDQGSGAGSSKGEIKEVEQEEMYDEDVPVVHEGSSIIEKQNCDSQMEGFHEAGQPLHPKDAGELEGSKIANELKMVQEQNLPELDVQPNQSAEVNPSIEIQPRVEMNGEDVQIEAIEPKQQRLSKSQKRKQKKQNKKKEEKKDVEEEETAGNDDIPQQVEDGHEARQPLHLPDNPQLKEVKQAEINPEQKMLDVSDVDKNEIAQIDQKQELKNRQLSKSQKRKLKKSKKKKEENKHDEEEEVMDVPKKEEELPAEDIFRQHQDAQEARKPLHHLGHSELKYPQEEEKQANQELELQDLDQVNENIQVQEMGRQNEERQSKSQKRKQKNQKKKKGDVEYKWQKKEQIVRNDNLQAALDQSLLQPIQNHQDHQPEPESEAAMSQQNAKASAQVQDIVEEEREEQESEDDMQIQPQDLLEQAYQNLEEEKVEEVPELQAPIHEEPKRARSKAADGREEELVSADTVEFLLEKIDDVKTYIKFKNAKTRKQIKLNQANEDQIITLNKKEIAQIRRNLMENKVFDEELFEEWLENVEWESFFQ